MNNVEVLWQKCLREIKSIVKETEFTTWFLPIVPIQFEENNLTLRVPSQFFYEYIEENYSAVMHSTFNRVIAPNVRLLYSIMVDHNNTNNGSVTLPTTNVTNISATSQPDNTNDQANPFVTTTQCTFDPNLNINYNFENYIEGESNRLARAAGVAIAEKPGKTVFNPIFIYGGPAVGKSHLANAIGLQARLINPKLRVLYITANLFQIQFSDAVIRNQKNDFLNFYQSIDVLIIDDIQEFIGKTKTQNTFFHIFNHLHQNGKQLIMCCDREPGKLQGMEDRLLSRFKWGLTVEVKAPDFELRKSILRHKIYKDGLSISDEVVEYIAENVTDSIRDIEGVLISILAHSTIMNAEINLQLAKTIISRIVETENSKRDQPISMDKICNIVCQHYSISLDALNSKSRKRNLSEPRQVAMYLARNHTNTSLNLIGEKLGNRDHSTVLYACKTIQNQMDVDKIFTKQIHSLESQIRE
ncbi:MAG: chromosomal replication initiator protein DnaA [bacterium]